MSSRRQFLRISAAAPFASPLVGATAERAAVPEPSQEQVSISGLWLFRLDRQNAGLSQGWHKAEVASEGWRTVTVPHTWQVEAENAEYMGAAWYRRTFEVPREWADRAVRVEFEAVFHSAIVWLNGTEAGRHIGKGYTAFTIDIWPHMKIGGLNTVVVRADNSFNDAMLPRSRSSDWAHDGGIYRPVQLLVTPKVFIESVAIDSDPNLQSGDGTVDATAVIRNASTSAWDGTLALHAIDDETGLTAAASAATVKVGPGERKTVALPTAMISRARLWHFDHPNLYQAHLRLSNGHASQTSFGIRKIETRNGGFYLNGERVRLMGVERMAGSNPEYGMAEPLEWLEHDNRDLKNLNCIYTRVHWPQDRRLLDWCDRNGMFIQTEVPTWGADTFKGMTQEPSDEILNNGLEQLREMIERDRNHPCIFSWGVCNETGGQNPPAYNFAKRLYAESKRLDPKRLVTYASNSLQSTPGKDVAGLMDYIMWNEYYESWYKGTPAELARNLDEIHQAFPDKAIVISEYGYCACTPERPEGDSQRIEVLREHDVVFREREYMGGLIFFCYNDYRTHIGDKGAGVAKQRVHGVVDLYGARKPSYEALRGESSPIQSIKVAGIPGRLNVTVRAREAVPSYTLLGYRVRAIVYGFAEIPVERPDVALPDLSPGQQASVEIKFREKLPVRVQVDVLRPTGDSALTKIWRV